MSSMVTRIYLEKYVQQFYHTLPTQIRRALAFNVKMFEKSWFLKPSRLQVRMNKWNLQGVFWTYLYVSEREQKNSGVPWRWSIATMCCIYVMKQNLWNCVFFMFFLCYQLGVLFTWPHHVVTKITSWNFGFLKRISNKTF